MPHFKCGAFNLSSHSSLIGTTLLLFFYYFHLVLPSDKKEVNDLKNAQSVHDEEGDKPPLLLKLGRAPEGESFPGKSPDNRCCDPQWMDAKHARQHSDRILVHAPIIL